MEAFLGLRTSKGKKTEPLQNHFVVRPPNQNLKGTSRGSTVINANKGKNSEKLKVYRYLMGKKYYEHIYS